MFINLEAINLLNTIKYILLLSLVISLTTQSKAATQLDLSYYFDSRDFNTFALFVQNKDLGQDFSVWGFSDFHGQQNNKSERFQPDRSFSEYRLSNSKLADWTGIDGLGLQVEYNHISPKSKNVWRGALTYKLPLGARLKMQLRILPIQNIDDEQVSIGYFYSINDKLNISGFADYNVRDDKKNQWVIEPQLNYKLAKDTWLIIEYRYNGFEDDNLNLEGSGWAIGLKWNAIK
ncbi:MAG: hypothetical protein ACI9N9_000267 [Enterobacterales bacterium]|jgi:hypothetical protein